MSQRQVKKLSPSWVETTDPRSGKVYYANTVTKESRWEYPEKEIEEDLRKNGGQARPVKQPKNESRPDKWLERQDPSTGRVFYYNPAQQKTSWYRPEEVVSTGAVQMSQGKGQWVERQDPRTGRPFYYNAVLGLTSWTNPDEEEEMAQAQKRKSVFGKHVSASVRGLAQGVNKVRNSIRMSIGVGGNNLGGGRQNSARFSMNMPQIPVNRNSARQSLRLGAQFDFSQAADDQSDGKAPGISQLRQSMMMQSARQGLQQDMFARLRKLKENGLQPSGQGNQEEETDLTSKLTIDLDREKQEMARSPWFRSLDITDSSTSLITYAQGNMKTRSGGGMFGGGRPLSLQQLVSFQNKELKQPLHEFTNKDLKIDSKMSFKYILGYLGLKKIKKMDELEIATLLCSYGVSTLDDFRCEMYAQLLKQLTNSPSVTITDRVMELMLLYAGTFLPPAKIAKVVKCQLVRMMETPESDRSAQLASHALLRMWKSETFAVKPDSIFNPANIGDDELNENGEVPKPQISRLEVPTADQAVAALEGHPFKTSVHLISSAGIIPIDVESWTTVGDLKEAIEFRYQIRDGSPFAIHEVSSNDDERYLEETDRVVDILSYWEKEKQINAGGGGEPLEFKFMYKIRLFFDILEDDTAAVELAYLQALYEVMDQRYPITREDVVFLAALEAQEKFGDYVPNSDVFGDELGAYVPSKYANVSPDEQYDLKREIYDKYSQIATYDKLLCMINYLKYVRQWKYFGSAYFFANPVNLKLLGKDFPPTVILGINAKGVLVIEPTALNLIADYPYSEIVTWGHGPNNFVLVVGNIVQSQKMYFETKDGPDMNALMSAYVNKLMEAHAEDERDGDNGYNGYNGMNNYAQQQGQQVDSRIGSGTSYDQMRSGGGSFASGAYLQSPSFSVPDRPGSYMSSPFRGSYEQGYDM